MMLQGGIKGNTGKGSFIVRVFADAKGGIKGNTRQRLLHCQCLLMPRVALKGMQGKDSSIVCLLMPRVALKGTPGRLLHCQSVLLMPRVALKGTPGKDYSGSENRKCRVIFTCRLCMAGLSMLL